MTPPARFVPQLMDELFEWMRKAKDTVHPLILSSVFHYEFVFIHPFADGNGRMEKFQEEYYSAIAKCHADGASTVFIEFMLAQIDHILEETAGQMGENSEQLTEYLKRLLEVMDYDVPYTAKAIMDRLGMKSKESLRKHYLHPALEMNLIRMTIPDKPKSRNQRYVRI